MIDYLVFYIVRAIIWLLGILPAGISRGLVATIVRVIFLFLPRYRKIALKNLHLAFPDLSEAEHIGILYDSYKSIARLICDFARIPYLSREWVEEHVEFPEPEIIDKVLKKESPIGVIFVTGHLGSFELLAYATALKGFPMSFVVRNFPNQLLDDWWNGRRGVYGNKVIARRGAVKNIVEALEAGENVGILFDQNVRIQHAVFVDFFGKRAATTKTVGTLAVKTRAPIMVATISYRGDDRYKINCVECKFDDIYDAAELSLEEKAQKITQVLSHEYEKMVRANPAAWFWMHRRWKTAPEGEKEDFYDT